MLTHKIDKLTYLIVFKLELYWIVDHDLFNSCKTEYIWSEYIEILFCLRFCLRNSRKLLKLPKTSKPGQIMGHFLGSFRATFPLFFPPPEPQFLLFPRFSKLNKLIWFAHMRPPVELNFFADRERGPTLSCLIWETDPFNNCFLSFLKPTKRTRGEWKDKLSPGIKVYKGGH